MVALWLVRHGEAVPEEVDPEQPLTEAGMAEAEAVAHALSRLGVLPTRVLHSGKRRAEQTADAVARALDMDAERAQGLKPLDDVEPWAARAQGEDLMLVGHLPFLERLASLLVCGRRREDAIRFGYCTVLMLQHADGDWHLVWLITPAMAEALSSVRTLHPSPA